MVGESVAACLFAFTIFLCVRNAAASKRSAPPQPFAQQPVKPPASPTHRSSRCQRWEAMSCSSPDSVACIHRCSLPPNREGSPAPGTIAPTIIAPHHLGFSRINLEITPHRSPHHFIIRKLIRRSHHTIHHLASFPGINWEITPHHSPRDFFFPRYLGNNLLYNSTSQRHLNSDPKA